MMNDEIQHKIFSIIEQNPNITQRELARQLGISLGKANYCLKAFMQKGWVKVKNFKNNKNKLGYFYLLTPSGIKQKSRITVRYLEQKMAEYDRIKAEIEKLKQEIEVSEFF